MLRHFLDSSESTAPSQIEGKTRDVCNVIQRYYRTYEVLEVDEKKTKEDQYGRTFYKVRENCLEDLKKEIDVIEQVHDAEAEYKKENQNREREKWKKGCLSDKEIETLSILEAQSWKTEKIRLPVFRTRSWNEWLHKMDTLGFIKTEGHCIEVTDDGKKFFKERLNKLRRILGCEGTQE